MDTLQNFIPQIGYGFVCSFWQMGLLFALYKLAASVYFPNPTDRFRFAFLLSVVGSLWFLYTVFLGVPSAQWQGVAAFSQNIPQTLSGLFYQSLYWLGYAYIVVFAFASLKGHFQWKATARMIYSGNEKAPVEWRMFIEKYAGLLGIKKKVILKISGTLSPVTYGFLKPVILLPASCLTGLSTEQLQAILLHELAHIRRGDYFAAWVLQLAGILLYFNPFMRQLVSEAKKECEHACDDLVLQFEYNPLQYAQALLSVAKTGQNIAWALQAQGSKHHLLLHRITRLVGQQQNNSLISLKNLGVTLFATLLLIATSIIHEIQSPTGENDGFAKFTSYSENPEPPKPWKQRLHEARMAILQAARSKSAAIDHNKKATIMQVAKIDELLAKNKESQAVAAALFTPASLVLSANWADEQQAEIGLQEMELAWQQFTLLLEKLELLGDLDETEWEQVAGLITIHAGIRETIYKETVRTQNLASFSTDQISIAEPGTNGKILVIVHEEATGKLAASFMNPDEINETYADETLPENRQKVILLRKKAPAGKRIISL